MQKFHYLLGCPLYIFGQSEQIAAYKNNDEHIPGVNLLENSLPLHILLYSYFMPVCSIVKTITPRCRGRPDALLHEAEGQVQ